MNPVHDRGSMDPVQGGRSWTPGPCFVLTRERAILYIRSARLTLDILPVGVYGFSRNLKD